MISYQPRFRAHFTDDTFIIIERNNQNLKNVYSDVQFTLKGKKSKELPFANVLIRRHADE